MSFRCCLVFVLLASCTPSAPITSEKGPRDTQPKRTATDSRNPSTETTNPPNKSTETGNPPNSSTEVGNPPIVIMKFLAWSSSMNGEYVVLSGEPGAVEPGGSKLEITNLSTGEVTIVTSNEDGSFRAEIPGSFEDGFKIRASDGTKKSDPVTVTREDIDMASDAGVDAGEPSDAGPDASPPDSPDIPQRAILTPAECRIATMSADAMIERSVAAVDRSCSVAEDCVFLRETFSTSCSTSCSTQVGSAAASAGIEDLVRSIERGACDDFKASGCRLEDPMCPPETRALMCVDGLCVAGDPTQPVSCESMTAEADSRLTALLESEVNTCRTDSECMLGVIMPDCFERCVAVSLRGFGELIDALTPVDEACADFERLGCEPLREGCTGDEPAPVCRDGRCIAM